MYLHPLGTKNLWPCMSGSQRCVPYSDNNGLTTHITRFSDKNLTHLLYQPGQGNSTSLTALSWGPSRRGDTTLAYDCRDCPPTATLSQSWPAGDDNVLLNAVDWCRFSMSTGSVLADDNDSVADVGVGGMSSLTILPSILTEQQNNQLITVTLICFNILRILLTLL